MDVTIDTPFAFRKSKLIFDELWDHLVEAGERIYQPAIRFVQFEVRWNRNRTTEGRLVGPGKPVVIIEEVKNSTVVLDEDLLEEPVEAEGEAFEVDAPDGMDDPFLAADDSDDGEPERPGHDYNATS